jgi:predicted alpha/beta-hydrolase family hydrolase
LVLTHGAGANSKSPLLLTLANCFLSRGFTVLRCDLVFRQRRPFGPPHPSGGAADRDGLLAAVNLLRARGLSRIYIGGHSYGGRQASMLAAEHPTVADALLLLSYPLHPPGKPEAARTAHFQKLDVPALFIHGEKDPFATSQELLEAASLISGRNEVLEVPAAGHDLKTEEVDVPLFISENFVRFIS